MHAALYPCLLDHVHVVFFVFFFIFFFFGSLQINNINTHIIYFLIASRIVKKSYIILGKLRNL